MAKIIAGDRSSERKVPQTVIRGGIKVIGRLSRKVQTFQKKLDTVNSALETLEDTAANKARRTFLEANKKRLESSHKAYNLQLQASQSNLDRWLVKNEKLDNKRFSTSSSDEA